MSSSSNEATSSSSAEASLHETATEFTSPVSDSNSVENEVVFSGQASTSNPNSSTTVTQVGMFYSPEFLSHRAPPGRMHPECPARLTVCVNALKADPDLSERIEWLDPPAVSDDSEWRDTVLRAVEEVHSDGDYLNEVRQVSETGGAIDGDTYVAPGSWEVALLAAGAWIAAVDRTMETGEPSFALARPPGHHATPDTGMGFCLLSNAAIAAKYALRHHGITRVAILDYDVHHGNGTEAAVISDGRIRFASSHQYPLYPMSGIEGIGGHHQTVLNINLSEGAGFDDYMPRYRDEMLPHISPHDETPDLVIVSAGYDALDDDPLAGLCFEPEDYKYLIRALVQRIGHTNIVLGLEGGYSLESNGISAGVCETIRGFFP